MNNETQTIEYKESWRDEYLRQICGLANAHGGSLFVGIDDCGNVVGVTKAKKLQEDIPNKVKDTLCIVPEVICHEQDGKEYLEVIVPENATPVSYKNKFYYRSGTVTSELSGTALHTFLLDKMGGKWDGQPVDGVTIEELDQESFDIFKREALRSGRMSRQDFPATRIELLDKLRLITDDGKLTRAAILLFHRDPERWVSCAYCKVALFADEAEILYHDEVHGSLMMQADHMLELIYTKYLIPRITFDGKLRIETYPYPKDAVREGLYNALMHNYYIDCAPIQVRINPDEMWISNDLAFNSIWTPERLMASHRSRPYNSLIANAFFWAGYVETWGRGIHNMMQDAIGYGCPSPNYIEQPNAVMLVLKAHPDTIDIQRNSAAVLRNKAKDKQLSDGTKSEIKSEIKNEIKSEIKSGTINGTDTRYNMILELILKDETISVEGLSNILKISKSKVYRAMGELQENGLLHREGGRKNGRWIVAENVTNVVENVTNNVTNVGNRVGNHVGNHVVDINARQRQVLRLMLADSKLSATDIAKNIGVSTRTIERDLTFLQTNNFIIRVGNTRGHWIVCDNSVGNVGNQKADGE